MAAQAPLDYVARSRVQDPHPGYHWCYVFLQEFCYGKLIGQGFQVHEAEMCPFFRC